MDATTQAISAYSSSWRGLLFVSACLSFSNVMTNERMSLCCAAHRWVTTPRGTLTRFWQKYSNNDGCSTLSIPTLDFVHPITDCSLYRHSGNDFMLGSKPR